MVQIVSPLLEPNARQTDPFLRFGQEFRFYLYRLHLEGPLTKSLIGIINQQSTLGKGWCWKNSLEINPGERIGH